MFKFLSPALKSWENQTKCIIRNEYFKRRTSNNAILTIKDMPHPVSLPLVGTKLQQIAAGSVTQLHSYIDKRHKKLGSIFKEQLGGNTDLVFVSDPEVMKSLFVSLEGKYPAHILPDPWVLYEKLYGSQRGLFFMNGEEWLENRRITNRHLLKEDSESCLEEPVRETVNKFVEKLQKMSDNDRNYIPNLESDLYRLSIDVLIAVLMGSRASFIPSIHFEELLGIFSEAVKQIFENTTKLSNLPIYWCYRLNLKGWRDFKQSVDTALLLANKIAREILGKKQDGTGLISRLSQENMTDEMISRIVADLIIAAGDTTAYTSLWTLYLLSKNEIIAKELRAGDRSQAKNVIRESMRLYPVAPFLTRILPDDSFIGPYLVPKRTPIIASIYTSGRDENNFSKAQEFLPYRWDRKDLRKAQLENHVASASLPFALGARSCIGRKLAMIQLSELVNQVVRNFDLKCLNASGIEAITSQVLIPDRPLQLLFNKRS